MTGALIRRGNLDVDMHIGRMLCEDEAEIQIILLQAKEHQRLPANHKKLGVE